MSQEEILLARIRDGEDSELEFKTEELHAESLASELVAFANAYGGMLLVGVNDEGEIIGTSRPDLADWVVNVCRHNIQPPLNPRLRWHHITGKRILMIEVKPGIEPYRTHKGIYYIRVGATKQIASNVELRRIFQNRGQVQFDESPIFNSMLDDIDLTRFADYYRRVYGAELDRRPSAIELTLRKNGVLVATNGELLPSVAGLLTFGLEPQQYLRMSGAMAVHYAGSEADSQEQLTRQELSGPLPKIIDQLVEFVRTHMPIPATKTSTQRQERPSYPLLAVREAVVNAVAHRDYSLTGARIRLLMFTDRLEIHSPGRLPNTQTLEDLGTRPPYARNQLIVGFLQRLGYIEFLGEGILTMRREMMQHNGTEPEFAEIGEEFRVRLWGKS